MASQVHNAHPHNRIISACFYPSYSPGKDPRKGWRIPLNEIKYNEQRDEETCYGYCDDHQPHAVRRMFNYKNGMLYDMRWDEAGNLGQVSMGKPGEMFERGRFLFWTEDCCGPRPCGANRMHTAVDDRYFSYYAYDHSGGSCASREQSQACLSYAEMEQSRRSQRRLKLVGDNSSMDVNADAIYIATVLDNPTLYPSAYVVLGKKEYTKHYYAGTDLCASREQSQACLSYAETKQSVRSNRVAARLGGGGLDALQHVIANDDELRWKADKLFKQSLDHVNHRVLHENNLDCIMQNEFSKEEFGYWIDDIPHQMKADVEIDHGQFKDMVNSMLTDYHNGEENEVYFYHSDHLGSASWKKETSGGCFASERANEARSGILHATIKNVQHLQYLPYGEPYINQHPFGYSERFTFTGKERDEETGYGYFGARYMDHELMTMWLSVDPMADKYPSISPYAYCAWNPVKLVDPDGNDWYEIVNEETGETEIKWTDYHSQKEMDDNKQAGTYLGEVFVQFNGSSNESLGDDNKMTGEGANPATVTIYGKNNEKDIHTYKGMTTPYSDSYSTLDEGDYRAYYEDMATSVYGEAGARKKNIETALTYRITQLDGNKTLKGKRNGKPVDMTSVFMHRTNWDGNASKSSKGCLVIDGRSWRDVENQIGKSSKIYIRVIR